MRPEASQVIKTVFYIASNSKKESERAFDIKNEERDRKEVSERASRWVNEEWKDWGQLPRGFVQFNRGNFR